MEKQSKEVSVVMWEQEKASLEGVDISENLAKLMQTVDRKINEYSITYDEYVDDVVEYLLKLEDTDDLDGRKKQIEQMYIDLNHKYEEQTGIQEISEVGDVEDATEQ